MPYKTTGKIIMLCHNLKLINFAGNSSYILMMYCKIPTAIVILMYTTRKILIAINHAHKKSGFFFVGQFLRGYEGRANLVGSSFSFPSRDSEIG